MNDRGDHQNAEVGQHCTKLRYRNVALNCDQHSRLRAPIHEKARSAFVVAHEPWRTTLAGRGVQIQPIICVKMNLPGAVHIVGGNTAEAAAAPAWKE